MVAILTKCCINHSATLYAKREKNHISIQFNPSVHAIHLHQSCMRVQNFTPTILKQKLSVLLKITLK